MTTRVALLTPSGRGAIASLAVDGPQALDAVTTCFRAGGRTKGGGLAQGGGLEIGRICVGIWKASASRAAGVPSGAGEELVVCRTGPQRIEVHCHGGAAAVAAILADLSEQGCREVAWSELIGADAPRPIQLAAQRMLAHATTERTAHLLLDQYHGALDHAVKLLLAELEQQRATEARVRIVALLQYADLGLHLTAPWRVVVAGPPNVGKSSLINALVGYQRAVVFDTPGTTRDVVTVRTAIDGWPIELSDTAGIRATDDALEAAGVERAIEQTRDADLVIWVFDATQLTRDAIRSRRRDLPAALLVCNKCDLRRPGPMTEAFELLETSTVTRYGLAELIVAVGRRLVPTAPPPGTAIPFQPQQVQVLKDVLECLNQGHALAAATLLRSGLSLPG